MNIRNNLEEIINYMCKYYIKYIKSYIIIKSDFNNKT